jgi:hypothetical protein
VSKYKPYSLFTPPFETTSGGVRVMYGLYGALLQAGQIVHLNAKYNHSDFIAIYPEIQQDNPAEANTVVRYILNKPGVMSSNGVAGPTEFGENDILYYFSRLFGETDESHYMFLPIINTHLFKDNKCKRNKIAYMIGKSQVQPKDYIHPSGSIEITRELAQDQEALSNLLNECSVLYCYDPVSAIMEIARLCGCRIIYIPSIYTKEELSKYEPGLNGISFGKDEGIELDTRKFTEHYMFMKELFNYKLDSFISTTQL